MELYIKVSFCSALIGVIFQIWGCWSLEWPVKRERTIEEQIMSIGLGAAQIIWAGVILWGR